MSICKRTLLKNLSRLMLIYICYNYMLNHIVWSTNILYNHKYIYAVSLITYTFIIIYIFSSSRLLLRVQRLLGILHASKQCKQHTYMYIPYTSMYFVNRTCQHKNAKRQGFALLCNPQLMDCGQCERLLELNLNYINLVTIGIKVFIIDI